MAKASKQEKAYLCRGDNTFHYRSELPKSLRSFVDFDFFSGDIQFGFDSFNGKIRNHIQTILPSGYSIFSWNKMHFECSAIIRTPSERYIYVAIPDVRYNQNEWFTAILYRSVCDGKESRSGANRFTDLFNLTDDIQKLEAKEVSRARRTQAIG